MQRGSQGGRGWSQAERGKPLLKCHSKGGEAQEPGPGMRQMDQNQEQVNQSAGKWSGAQELEDF